MRIAQIKNGVVVNIIMAGDGYEPADGDVASETANIGDKFDGKKFAALSPKVLDDEYALNFARGVCDAKITKSYSANGMNRRQSLYGYLAYLSAISAAGKMTDDQKSDLLVLIAVAEWEEKMISAIPKIAASGDTSDMVKAKWPELSPDVADKLSALASVS